MRIRRLLSAAPLKQENQVVIETESVRIRRLLSAAPLKRAGELHGVTPATCIRRLLSAAPLKQVEGNAICLAGITYPPITLGGPIEARAARAA